MQPNILFIMTDQQAADALSLCGNPAIRTPNIDQLARGGIRFTRSYCASPVCGPARAALMTGRMPHDVGVNVNDDPFVSGVRTLGHMFRDAGYDTAYAGKWHLPQSDDMDALGFSELPFHATRLRLGEECDGPITDAAVAYLRQPHDRPFLLTVSLVNPHDICYDLLEDRVVPRTEEQGPSLPANFPADAFEPEFVTRCRRRRHYGQENIHTRGWTLDHWRGYLHQYYRYVEMVDQQVGRLLDALREQGLADQTLVVFTSDHGEGVAAHQWVVKLMLYEEPARTPLIMRWPGRWPEGVTDSEHLVSAIDLLPTLCDVVGVPADVAVTGVSLRPVLEGSGAADVGREMLVCELQPDTKRPDLLGRMVRTRRFKYVAFSVGDRREMLFDLDVDPLELNDLAEDAAFTGNLLSHRALLSDWCRQTSDRFPVMNP